VCDCDAAHAHSGAGDHSRAGADLRYHANIAFVSVTQHFHSGTSMCRLVLNVLLSFAQFERELIAERTRDKMAAARRKGTWAGGLSVLGYEVDASAPFVDFAIRTGQRICQRNSTPLRDEIDFATGPSSKFV
jgi:hypothetical protein